GGVGRSLVTIWRHGATSAPSTGRRRGKGIKGITSVPDHPLAGGMTEAKLFTVHRIIIERPSQRVFIFETNGHYRPDTVAIPPAGTAAEKKYLERWSEEVTAARSP